MDTDVGKSNESSRFYASCSSCGHILGRALNGSDNEVDCPKCGAKINYKIAESTVTVKLLVPSTKTPSMKAKGNRNKSRNNNLAGAVNQ